MYLTTRYTCKFLAHSYTSFYKNDVFGKIGMNVTVVNGQSQGQYGCTGVEYSLKTRFLVGVM